MHCVFLIFLPHFKVFINIHYYANKIICISDGIYGMKGLFLGFNLVPRFVV